MKTTASPRLAPKISRRRLSLAVSGFSPTLSGWQRSKISVRRLLVADFMSPRFTKTYQ